MTESKKSQVKKYSATISLKNGQLTVLLKMKRTVRFYEYNALQKKQCYKLDGQVFEWGSSIIFAFFELKLHHLILHENLVHLRQGVVFQRFEAKMRDILLSDGFLKK
jgi:hypothetical protein